MIARRAVRYSTGYSPSWVHRISVLYSVFIAFSRCRVYFIRRVHGQLRKADVDRIQCHMAPEMLPSVEPPSTSDRLMNTCKGTSALAQMTLNSPAETASVVYFWFALYLMTTPPFITG